LIHGPVERFQSYFWITKGGRVFETRGLNREDQRRLVEDRFADDARDFTVFLNNWEVIRTKLGAEPGTAGEASKRRSTAN
jgi:hypothetical protein